MTRTTRTVASLGTAMVLAIGTAGPATAGNQSQQSTGASQQTASEVSDAKVKSFADAASDVSAVAKEYQSKIQSAKKEGNQKKARQHANEARRKMKQAIKAQEGISVQEYKDITKKARQDAKLKTRIRKEMQKSGSGSGSES